MDVRRTDHVQPTEESSTFVGPVVGSEVRSAVYDGAHETKIWRYFTLQKGVMDDSFNEKKSRRRGRGSRKSEVGSRCMGSQLDLLSPYRFIAFPLSSYRPKGSYCYCDSTVLPRTLPNLARTTTTTQRHANREDEGRGRYY